MSEPETKQDELAREVERLRRQLAELETRRSQDQRAEEREQRERRRTEEESLKNLRDALEKAVFPRNRRETTR